MLSVVRGSSPSPPIASDVVRALQEARRCVGSIGGDAWTRVVRLRDPVELVRGRCQPVISRAYFKLCEMRRLIPSSDVSSALFLCEAPGGFYQAAGRMFPDAKRVATSLEHTSPRFHRLVPCDDVVTGLPSKGDIRDVETIDALVALLGPNSFDLVTADGGIGHDDLDMVEQGSIGLLIGQVVAMLRLTREGGSCVIKIFEGSNRATRDVVSVLRKLFAGIHLCKPRTSKAANSERYLIANGLLNVSYASSVADDLSGVLQVPYPLAILDHPDEDIGKAFDALAVKQTQELHLLINAAQKGGAEVKEVASLARHEADWLCRHVSF